MTELITPTLHPFGEALQAVFRMRRQFLHNNGNVNWRAAAQAVPDVSYETLRKAVSGERVPSADLVNRVAEAYGLPTHYFLEARLDAARQELDPRRVGVRRAVEALKAWEEAMQTWSPETSG